MLLALLLFYLVIMIIIIYITFKILITVANALFISGEGRKIRGDGPFIRRLNVYRILARSIDYLVIAVPILLILLIAGPYLGGSSIGVPVLLGTGIVYFPMMNSLTGGRTVGKAVFGLEVVSTVGQQSYTQLLIREVVFVLSAVVGLFLLPVYVIIKNTEYEQPGDIIADTRVVSNGPTGVAGLSTLLDVAELQNAVPGPDGDRTPAGAVETQLQTEDESTTLQTGATESQGTAGVQQTTGGSDGSSADSASGETEIWEENECPNCGGSHPANAMFCPDCGTNLR